jgi:NitT/TauT family transport system substrate-binding protein
MAEAPFRVRQVDANRKELFDKMAAAGVIDPRGDYKKAYTLQFVNKGVGVDLRPK